MAKAKLEYDLNDPDDRADHLRAVHSLNMALALWDILYNSCKEVCNDVENRMDRGETVGPYDAIHLYRERIGELVEKQLGTNIDTLIQ